MKSQRKFKPGWDDASYLMRTDVEREKKPRLESGKLPEQEFSFDFAAIRKAWEAVGVHVNEFEIRAHVVELAMWQRPVKKIHIGDMNPARIKNRGVRSRRNGH